MLDIYEKKIAEIHYWPWAGQQAMAYMWSPDEGPFH